MRNSTTVRATLNYQKQQQQQAMKLQTTVMSPTHQVLSNVQSAVNFATTKPNKLLQAHNHPSEAETAISMGTHGAKIGYRTTKGGASVRPTTAGRPSGNVATTRMDLTQGTLTVSGF